MNPFLKSPEDRLKSWKNLRAELLKMNEEDQLTQLIKYWSQCPLSMHSFDWTDPDTWETPWEMLYHCNIDRNSIAYLMEQTLIIDGWDENRFKLLMYKDTLEQILILLIDDSIVLNYDLHNKISIDDLKGEYQEKYKCVNNKHILY